MKWDRKITSSVLLVGLAAPSSELCSEQPAKLTRALHLPVQYGQVFAPPIPVDHSRVGNERGMIWAGNAIWAAAVPRVRTLVYTTAYRLCCRRDRHGIEWLYSFHPDWIEYRRDRITPAWEFADTNYPPVDIASIEVRHFLLEEDLRRAQGAQGLGIDNVRIQNAFLRAGHYAGSTTLPCKPQHRPACGGVWIQQYSGAPTDDAWRADNLQYIEWMHEDLKRNGLATFINLNYQGGPEHIQVNRAADGSMAEGFPQHGCDTLPNHYFRGFVVDRLWQAFFYDVFNDSRRWWFAVSYLCGHDTDGMTRKEEAWNTANYLFFAQDLANNFFSAGAQGSHKLNTYPASTNPPIGPYSDPVPTPGSCGGSTVGSESGVCVRRYYADPQRETLNGIVLVNSSSVRGVSYLLPTGAFRWTDQFCERIPARNIQVAPAAAAVLVTTTRKGHCRAKTP